MRVAIDELQLHDLQNIEAIRGSSIHEIVWIHIYEVPAVDVQQNARPATADVPMVPNTPARGKEMRAPILNDYGTSNRECG